MCFADGLYHRQIFGWSKNDATLANFAEFLNFLTFLGQFTNISDSGFPDA